MLKLYRKAIGIWRNEELQGIEKKNIYNITVKSILEYGSEAWRLTEAEKRKLSAVEMGKN